MLMGVVTQHLLSRLQPDLCHLNVYGYRAGEWVFAFANFQKIETQQLWTAAWQIDGLSVGTAASAIAKSYLKMLWLSKN